MLFLTYWYLYQIANPDASAIPLQRSTLISNNALVFNRGATGVDNDDFDKKFSLAKTLTNSRMRAKFVLRDIRFMILNLKYNFADYDKKFSLAKTLTNIRNSSNATTDSSNATSC
jgi:hypothetical protein